MGREEKRRGREREDGRRDGDISRPWMSSVKFSKKDEGKRRKKLTDVAPRVKSSSGRRVWGGRGRGGVSEKRKEGKLPERQPGARSRVWGSIPALIRVPGRNQYGNAPPPFPSWSATASRSFYRLFSGLLGLGAGDGGEREGEGGRGGERLREG